MNEIQAQYNTGSTLYAVVLNTSGYIWNSSVFVTPVASSWATYVINLIEKDTTGLYEGDFPSIAYGVYGVACYVKASSGVPVPSDYFLGSSNFQWGGTSELGLSDITQVTNKFKFDPANNVLADVVSGGISNADIQAIKAQTDRLQFDGSNNVLVDVYQWLNQTPLALVSGAVVAYTTGSSVTGTVIVGGYSPGQDPASYILITSSDKLWTDNTGAVKLSSSEHYNVMTDVVSALSTLSIVGTGAISKAVWEYVDRTLTSSSTITLSGAVIVGGYLPGQSPTDYISADVHGRVNVNLAQNVPASGSDVVNGSIGRALQLSRGSAAGMWTVDPTLNTLTLWDLNGITVIKVFDLSPGGGPYTTRTPQTIE